jgi:DNA polymerase-3 subunit gamma/tau
MAYQVLARKYRPQLFSDVIGQDHVTRTLLNALQQNRIAHGYIFSGHRGIGKTTIARILASALNCRNEIGSAIRPTPEPCNACESCLEIRQGNAVDVIEIDAATNRGIDEIRELRDAARYRPSRDKFKIYILDEAHQITDAAFNALLKTLEEPPDHIVFMMATTQPEDIPQTIRSRCQHFSFHAVKLDDIVGQLRLISTAEEIVTDDATLSLLAEAGDGSMRDALSIMDQAIASAPLVDGHPALEISQVRELMGSVSNVVYENILHAVHANNSADVLAIVGRLLDAGNGAPQLARQFVRYIRNVLVAKVTRLHPNTPATGVAADLLQISPEERQRAARTSQLFGEEELSRFLAIMLRTFDELGYRQEQRFHLELGLLKLVHLQRLLSIEEILSQLGAKPTSTPERTPTRLSSADALGMTPPAGAPARVSTPVAASTPSPFDTDRSRKTPVASSSTFEPSQPSTLGSMALAPEPKPAPLPASSIAHTVTPVPEPISDRPHLVQPVAYTPPSPAAPTRLPEETIDIAAGSISEPSADLATLQSACVSALAAAKGQQSASEQIEDAAFTVSGDTLNIQTTLSKTMLPVVLNADCERILKSTVRSAGIMKLNFLPGAPAPASSTPKKARAAASGSAAELAEKHPVVQEARRLFSADISNVIDLRGKS